MRNSNKAARAEEQNRRAGRAHDAKPGNGTTVPLSGSLGPEPWVALGLDAGLRLAGQS